MSGRDRRGDDAEEADDGRGQDRATPGTPRLLTVISCDRGLAAGGQHEQHPRRGVEARVQAGQHRGQHHRVHDVVGVRDAHRLEGADVRRGAELGRSSTAGSPRAGRSSRRRRSRSATITELVALAIARSGSVGLGGGDGGDLGADHREDHHDDARRRSRPTPLREEAAVRGQVAEVQALVRPEARARTGVPSTRKTHDRGDLDAGEPELELAERASPRTGWSPSSASSGPSDSSHSGASIQ